MCIRDRSEADAKAAGLYEVIGQAVDDAYMKELKSQVIHMDAIRETAKDLSLIHI